MLDAIHEASRAKVFFHSCGNIYPLIGDLIDIGVDLLNPVQVSARDLADTARLKREFGKRLSFCGAIDTQSVLPYGSESDVRTEVRRRIRDLAPGGGYVAAAVHCIQPDVPPANIVAMADEVKSAGRYPLKV
jgi:uroporphyrinogen decarboxylase